MELKDIFYHIVYIIQKEKNIMKQNLIYILIILSNLFFIRDLQSYNLPGFSIYPYFNEQVKVINFNPEVRIFINAPSAQNFDPTKRVGLALFALPNGNTIENTIGKILKPGDDWHYDIQHIGAQTRFLRNINLDYNLVTVYLETVQKSWPSWRTKYANNAALIKTIMDSVKSYFSQFNPFTILTGHSGGGSMTFGYLNGVTNIANDIERITFLDSDYNYDNTTYGQKFVNWINAAPNHYLCVIAYNDSIALYNGQPVVSPTGGTWYRSRMFATYLANYYQFTTEIDSNFIKYTALNGRIKFILKQNPTRAILHTVQVELNGFIHGLLTGTTKENQGYTYYGSRAYTPLVQYDVVFPAPLNIPPRQSNAKTGSEFMNYVTNMTIEQRENEIYKEISQGNIPDFLRNLKRLSTTFTDLNGNSHNIFYDVMPDYLAIGSNENYCRIPMGPKTAQRLADLFGAILPTPKLVDDIYSKSEIKLAPVTYAPVGNQNELVPKFVLHNTAIDSQRVLAGGQLGQSVGGTKKDVVLSNKITDPTRTHHVCIYGWHQLNGQPIQPLTNIHIDTYVDYSHGVRFLNREFLMDSTVKNMMTVLKDPILYKVLSNETGVMTQPSYIKDTTFPPVPKSFGFIWNGPNSVSLVIKYDTTLTGYSVLISKDGKAFNDSVFLTSPNLVINNLLTDTLYYFKIRAINTIGSSAASEVLACIPSNSFPKSLIVHGFDRNSTGNTKDFIRFHASAFKFHKRVFNSATNDAIIDSLFILNDYLIVDYILGDESTVDETFSSVEQELVKNYLRRSKNLFVSGSEIAWDLDNKGTTTDKDFINNYLKTKYIADAPNGLAGSCYLAQPLGQFGLFPGISSSVPYDNGTHGTINVSYPDVIKNVGNGAYPFLKYSTLDTANGWAANAFLGTVPNGNLNPSKVVFIGFPFESIYVDSVRNELMKSILIFFDITINVDEEKTEYDFNLYQNYPNPFNPTTSLKFSLKNESKVKLIIYGILGNIINVLVDENRSAGSHTVYWNGKDLTGNRVASGIYLYRLEAGDYIQTKKMALMK